LSRVRDEMDRILPAAENLFQAAYSIYQGGQLDDAEPLLRQAVRLNPNHIKANQHLAEILLAKGDMDEALKILEILYEYNPSDVKHRLVQVLLVKSKSEKDEDRQLAIYEKILKIEPNHSESLAEYTKIYEKQGDEAYKNNELDKALEFYKKTNSIEKIEKVNKKLQLEVLYQQALTALEKNEKEKAQRLLVEVLSIEPSYREATRYIHLAVTGIDVIELYKITSKTKKQNENIINKQQFESINQISDKPQERNMANKLFFGILGAIIFFILIIIIMISAIK